MIFTMIKNIKYVLITVFVFQLSLLKAQEKSALNVVAFETAMKTAVGAQLVDVRTPQEYIRGHIRKAININFNDDNFEELIKTKLDKSRPVYVYCFSGKRSTDAVNFMRELGYKKIFELEGGFAKWTAASKPYVSMHSTTEPIAAFTMDNVDKVLRSNEVVILDFFAEWCGPCKKMDPILKKVVGEKNNIKLLKIDAEKNDGIAANFKVDEIPTYIIFNKGKQVWRGIGEMKETELRDILARLKI